MTALTAEVQVNVLIEGQTEPQKVTVGGMIGPACPFTTFGELMYALNTDQRFSDCDPQSIQIYDGFLQRFVPIDPKETIPDQIKIKLALKKALNAKDFIAPASNGSNGLLSTVPPPPPISGYGAAVYQRPAPEPILHQAPAQPPGLGDPFNGMNGNIRSTPTPAGGFQDLLSNFLSMSSSERNVFMKLASEAGFSAPNTTCRSFSMQGAPVLQGRSTPILATGGVGLASFDEAWPQVSPIRHLGTPAACFEDHECEPLSTGSSMNHVCGESLPKMITGHRSKSGAGGDGLLMQANPFNVQLPPHSTCTRREIRSDAAQIPTQIRKILRKKPPFFAERAAQMLLLSDRIGRHIMSMVSVFRVARNDIIASTMSEDQFWLFIATKMRQVQLIDSAAAFHSNLQVALFRTYLGHYCLVAHNSDSLVEANVLWPFFSLIHQNIIQDQILEKTVARKDVSDRILAARLLIESRQRSKFGCVNQIPDGALKSVALSPDAQFRAAVYNFWSESLNVRQRNLRLLDFLARHREQLARAHSRGHEIWKRVTNELNNNLEHNKETNGENGMISIGAPLVVSTLSSGKYFNYFRTTQATFEKLISFYNSMCQNVNSLEEAEMIWPRGFLIINLNLIDCALLLKLGVNPTLADKAIRVHEAARSKFISS